LKGTENGSRIISSNSQVEGSKGVDEKSKGKKLSKVKSGKSKMSKSSRVRSSESSSDYDSDSEQSSDEGKKKRKKKTKKKSGISAKSSDTVVNRQRYPHAHLRYEFVSSNISFQRLDMNLFVAGELEIIGSCKSSHERQGRTEFLKRLMYLSSNYDFSSIKSLFAAVLRDIEIGYKQWSDDFGDVENAILHNNTSKSRGTSSFVRRDRYDGWQKNAKQTDEEKLWFCSPYQRNKCLHKAAQTITVNGRMRWTQHMCATCWKKDSRKLEHPECSSACPYSQK